MTRSLRVWTWPDQAPPHYLASFIAPAVWSKELAPNHSQFQNDVLGHWLKRGAGAVQLCEPHSADLAVLPFTLEAIGEHPELWEVACRLAAEAEREQRVMLVFCQGDRHIPPPSAGCVMLRTALSRSSAGPADVAVPAWIADPHRLVSAEIRPHVTRPTLSFTGWAHPLGQSTSALARIGSWTRFGVRVTATRTGVDGHFRIPAADAARVLAIQSLRASRSVDFRLRLRPAMTRLDLDLVDDREQQLQMLQDIAAADYGLAVRGLGNYSYRLYEVLGSGRRPLIIDTGAVLPRARAVDWGRLAVIVPLRRVARAGARLNAAHNALSDIEWTGLQRECRSAWIDHLSADGFFRHIVDAVVRLSDRGGAARLGPVEVALELR